MFVDLDVASSWEPPLRIPVVDEEYLSSIGVDQHAVGNEVLWGRRRLRCSEDLIAGIDPSEDVESVVDLSGIARRDLLEEPTDGLSHCSMVSRTDRGAAGHECAVGDTPNAPLMTRYAGDGHPPAIRRVFGDGSKPWFGDTRRR